MHVSQVAGKANLMQGDVVTFTPAAGKDGRPSASDVRFANA